MRRVTGSAGVPGPTNASAGTHWRWAPLGCTGCSRSSGPRSPDTARRSIPALTSSRRTGSAAANVLQAPSTNSTTALTPAGQDLRGIPRLLSLPARPVRHLRDESTDPELRERFLKADTGSVLDCLRNGELQPGADRPRRLRTGRRRYQGPDGDRVAVDGEALGRTQRPPQRPDGRADPALQARQRHARPLQRDRRRPAVRRHARHAGRRGISHDAAGVRVTLADGTVDTANAVVVTVPIGALSNSTSPPRCPSAQQDVIARARTRSASRSGSRSTATTRSSPAHPATPDLVACAARSSSKTRTPPSWSASAPTTTAIDLDDIDSAQKAINVWRTRPRGHRLRRPRLGRRQVVRPDLGHAEVRPVLQRLEPVPGVLDASANSPAQTSPAAGTASSSTARSSRASRPPASSSRSSGDRVCGSRAGAVIAPARFVVCGH